MENHSYIFVHNRNIPVGDNGVKVLGFGGQESPEGSSVHARVVGFLITGVVGPGQTPQLSVLGRIQGIHVQLQ